MPIHTLHRGSRRYSLNDYPVSSSMIAWAGFPVPAAHLAITTNWSEKVVSNGGATPSDGTLTAIDNFWTTLVNYDLTGSIYEMNIYAPDSLIACTTPLTSSVNNLSWSNHNFLSGDLTVNGLKGDGSTKYLDTGISPARIFNTGSAGLTYYITSTPGGATEGVEPGFRTYWNNNPIYWDCWNTGGGRLSTNPASSSRAGFISWVRTTTAASAVYYASVASGSTVQNIASGTGQNNIGSPPGGPTIWFNGCNGLSQWFSVPISFAALHAGMSVTQSQGLFNAVKTLRNALGGGAV